MKALLHINLKNAGFNFNFLKSQTDKKIICVVKSDAYGHGIKNLAKVFDKCGADAFAVSDYKEGANLREVGIEKQILVLSPTNMYDVKFLREYDLTQSLPSLSYAESLDTACRDLGVKLNVHVKIDTGMHRFGFPCLGDCSHDYKRLFNLKNLSITGLYSHFSSADNTKSDKTIRQIERFYLVKKRYFDGVFTHFSNSAAFFNFKGIEEDAVRIGLALYGFLDERLKPIMSLSSEIINLTYAHTSDGIGYSGENFNIRSGVFGVLPIGYANGFFPSPCSFFAKVNDKPCLFIAKPCMNHTFLDSLGNAIAVGDKVDILNTAQDFINLSKSQNLSVYQTLVYLGCLNDREYE